MEVEIIKAKNTLSNSTRGQLTDRLRVAAYCRVSTDSEDQLNSYKSQVQYYTDMITKNKEWAFADIYADEAITGTQIKNREDFQRMINDCMNGEIDMIITKSISRFARNTLDTLKYVRLLKEKNVAVYFEEEKINTLTMDGELLLVILSSVAQQEVENISENVKKGLRMKMQRGELIGFQGCLGYDYHPEDKTITVNKEEAEIVRYIFERYAQGAGSTVIAHELNQKGYKSKRGNAWSQSTILGIIRNEKYIGDVRLQKTFTVDPISKRRLDNYGEEDQFYIKNHHETIISNELYEKVQELANKRGKVRVNGTVVPGKREKYSRQYSFSSMLECAFCGSNLSRRSWHSNSAHHKTIWQCVTGTKKGKKYCPHSKGIAETDIEQAFIESYRLLATSNKDVLDEFLERVENTLSSSNVSKNLVKIDKEIESIDQKKKKLLDLRLEDAIDKQTYDDKMYELEGKRLRFLKEREAFAIDLADEKNLKKRVIEFKKLLEQNQVLEEFDRTIFESIVEKVIVGEKDEDGNIDPYKLTFVYKTGMSNKIRTKKQVNTMNKAESAIQKMCSYVGDGVKSLCSDSRDDTRGDGSFDVKKR